MKVRGPGPSRPTAGKSNVGDKSKDKGGQSFEVSAADDSAPAETAAPLNATSQIAYVDALLAMQGAEDPGERASRGRMRRRALDVLDELERIRTSLMLGTLTIGHLLNVADVVTSHRERIDDPQMTSILDEIDLRAQIEIAKMRYALDHSEDHSGDGSESENNQTA
jgi:hypothetical protein